MPKLRRGVLACIDACQKCVVACEICLDACLGNQEMSECARSCRDCADLASLAIHYLARESHVFPQLCALLADVTELCAEECEKHEACHDCASACRHAAEACRELSVGG